MLRTLRSLSPALAVALLAAPAAAHAAPVATTKVAIAKVAAKRSKVTYPTISSISPRKITIGQKLTIRGKNFKPGKGKSSVAFYTKGKAIIFVKVDTATKTKLTLTLPTKLGNLLAVKNGKPERTLLRMRVVASKMGRVWTQNSRSPLVSPLPAVPLAPGTDPNSPASVQQALAILYKTCQETAAANPAGDQDADSLSNGTEASYKLDPCVADTDGDGLNDGWEFQSARDLNGASVPYPGTRPWPNPLDPSDTQYDFDGDGLMITQEYKLWVASGSHFPVTQYSDGTQNSGPPHPVTTQAEVYLDTNRDGNLTDDERDFDGDGISNVNEFNITGRQKWWNGVDWKYQPHGSATSYKESPYTRRAFSDLDATNPDTDGDGIPDGADDQDNDGWSNFVEMQLSRYQSGYRVHPFNPCLPDPHAYTCSRYVFQDEAAWPPFDLVDVTNNIQSVMPGDAIPVPWPVPIDYASWSSPLLPTPKPAPATYPTGVLPDATDPAVRAATPWFNDQDWLVANGAANDLVRIPTWQPRDFGSWDPAGWFTEGWDGFGGHQGPPAP
jgi:hypothetical protein